MRLPLVVVLAALVGFVLFSSLLGLTRPMVDDPVDGGWSIFTDVWGANFWGDVTFTLGTMAVVLGTAYLVRRSFTDTGARRWILLGVAIVGGLLFHWAVYAFSWSMSANGTIHNYLEGENGSGATGEEPPSFWGWEWDMMYDEPLLGLKSAWTFTWCWGWAGLILTSLVVPALAWTILWRQSLGAVSAAKGPQAPTGQRKSGKLTR
jgi:hypothetical protein